MVLTLAAAPALAAEPSFDFNLPAGQLNTALMALAGQSHQQFFYTQDVVAGRRVAALKGRFTTEAALARLLAGSGIEIQKAAQGVLVLRTHRPIATKASVNSQSGSAAVDPPVFGATDAAGPIDPPSSPPETPPQPVESIGEIVVTGTHLRGTRWTASPVHVLTREDLDHEGRATVADALAALPQAFGGTATEETGFVGADAANTNSSFASSINLRGLGADATLVLINGRRLAGSGTKGDFNDLSAIPMAAVERIDVLLDGASAIYGSDAVGGVVNIIMRDDFQGAETRVRLGSVTDGGAEEAQVAQTFGKRWTLGSLGAGSALISVENYRRTALAAADRPYAGNTDLVALGGSDHRTYYSNPGNIIGYDPTTGSFGPTYAIPSGQNGVGLQPGDFLAGQINLENGREGMDLLPLQDRTSLYGAFTQELGKGIKLSLDLRASNRTYRFAGPASTSIFQVTPANPFYVSPNGASSEYLAYSFYDELGPSEVSGHESSFGLTLGADADLPGGWQVRGYGAVAQDHSWDGASHAVNSDFLNEALGNSPVDPGSRYSPTRDGYLNPFGAGAVNNRTVLDFINQGYSFNHNLNRVTSLNLEADGPLFNLPAGPVRLAIGAQARHEVFQYGGVDFIDHSTPTALTSSTAARDVDAGFAELRVPLFGPANARVGLERLELSLAGRIEHYSDVGTTANPKFGVIWVPANGLTIRGTYGTSFRAPALREVHDPLIVAPTILPDGANQVLTRIMYGGNPKLRPQTATSATAGVEYVPKALPDLKLSATYFDTSFERRIGTPALDNALTALSDPTLTDFVTRFDPATNAADLAKVTALINSPGSLAAGLFPAQAYGAIVDARYVNTAHLHVQGVDFQGAYAFPIPLGRIDLSADATYLATYTVQSTPTAPAINDVNVVGYPTSWRGRLAATWTWDPWGATAAVNYVGAHHDAGDVGIGSWTTVDLQLRWRAPEKSGLAHGVELSLNVQNLFDQDPPFYNSPSGVGYDATTASALGRFVAMQLVKTW